MDKYAVRFNASQPFCYRGYNRSYFVVVDPCEPGPHDEHMFTCNQTRHDVVLAMAVANFLMQNLVDMDYVNKYTLGFTFLRTCWQFSLDLPVKLRGSSERNRDFALLILRKSSTIRTGVALERQPMEETQSEQSASGSWILEGSRWRHIPTPTRNISH